MHFSSPRSVKAWHPWIWAHLDDCTSRLLCYLFLVCFCFSPLISLTFHASGVAQSSTCVASFKIWSHDRFFSSSGKRKALKLNFANPPIKPTTRFTLNTAGPPFQNPHMWVNPGLQHLNIGLVSECVAALIPFVLLLERGWEHTVSSHQESWSSPRSSTGTSRPKISKIWARSAAGLTAPSTRWCTSRVTRSWRWRWFTFWNM